MDTNDRYLKCFAAEVRRQAQLFLVDPTSGLIQQELEIAKRQYAKRFHELKDEQRRADDDLASRILAQRDTGLTCDCSRSQTQESER